MLKKILRPFQDVLLSKNMCPGCTYPLDKIKKRDQLSDTKQMLQCKCKRRYIFDLETRTYRRATLEEEQEFLSKK